MNTAQTEGQGRSKAFRRCRLSRLQAIRKRAADTITLGSSTPTTGCKDRGIQAASDMPPTSKSKNHLLRKNFFMVSRFHGKPDYNLAEMETETTEMDGILRIRRRLQGD
jgi:hypothetical protein